MEHTVDRAVPNPTITDIGLMEHVIYRTFIAHFKVGATELYLWQPSLETGYLLQNCKPVYLSN